MSVNKSVSVKFRKEGKRKKRSSQFEMNKENCADSQWTYFDTLTLRHPPSALVASVPRPRRAHLPGGLPLWNQRPLDYKLPLMKGPDGPVVFTRGKLGEKLWKGGVSEFQLSDPHGYEVRFDYEPSHDKHLRSLLHKSDTLQVLNNQDLVTPSLRVKCSVQQYNNFRKFLYGLYRDQLRQEADKLENKNIEKLMVKKANENLEKEMKKKKKLEDSAAKRQSNVKKLESEKLEKLKNCKKRLQRVIDRANEVEERKETDLAERKRRMAAFDERIKSRVTMANYIERMSKIKAMKHWHKQDVEKKKMFETRRQKREQENKQKAETRWKTKVEEQKNQIAKEKCLYQQRKDAKELYKQQYMKAMQKEWTRMEDELNMRKCRGTLDKVKDKRSKSMRQILRSVSEAYSAKKSLALLSQDPDTYETLQDRIQIILKDIRYDLEPYIVIAHAKGRLEKQENVPLPVSGAIKFLLEETIVEYTAKQLAQTINTTAKKMLTTIDEIKLQPGLFFAQEAQSMSIKMSSVSGLHKMQSLTSGRNARISDVHEIPLRKTSGELVLPANDLRRTKDRAPTPMPSIATFTEVVFRESANEELVSDDEGAANFAFVEQKKLQDTINDVSSQIYRMVPSRVRAVVESRSYDRISTLSSTSSVQDLPENKPVAKLCSLILFEDSVREHTLTKIVDRMILGFMQDINLTPSFLRMKIKQKLEATTK